MAVRSSGRLRQGSNARGTSLFEAVLATAMLALGALAHASSTVAEHHLARELRAKSEVLPLARQFLERLRADEDWAGLYDTLRSLEERALDLTPRVLRGIGGSATLSVHDYFPDLLPGPVSLGVVVQVPLARAERGGAMILREDVPDPRFGLPADLNGDGRLDANDRSLDYVALPVRVVFRWTAPDGQERRLPVSTWLRGQR